MEQDSNTFRYLIKIAGKILFVIGLVLNILMVFFGLWPSVIYILIMLAGAGMFSLNKHSKINFPSFQSLGDRLKKLASTGIPSPNYKAIVHLFKTALIVFSVLILIGLLSIWVSQDYFKKRDTINDCQNIAAALHEFYKQQHKYPDSLSSIIYNNPMRRDWLYDRWGNKYSFKAVAAGKHYVLTSAGKDSKFNTPDDLVFKSN